MGFCFSSLFFFCCCWLIIQFYDTHLAEEEEEGCGGKEEGVVHSETTSYMNAQHSNVLTQKSSSGLRGSLPKVLQVCERPWFKSPSSHRPNLPLEITKSSLIHQSRLAND